MYGIRRGAKSIAGSTQRTDCQAVVALIRLDDFMPPLALFLYKNEKSLVRVNAKDAQAPKRSLGGGLAYIEREWRGNATLGLVSILGGLASFC